MPRTPDEIAADALHSLEAGASILHNHNADVLFESDTCHEVEPYLRAWEPVLERRPDALFYPTMGGGPHITCEDRYAHVPALCEAGVLRMGPVDPSSLNFGGYDADGIPAPSGIVYQNTLGDIRYMLGCLPRTRARTDPVHLRAGFRTGDARLSASRCLAPGHLRQALLWSRARPFWSARHRARARRLSRDAGEKHLPWSVALLGGDVIQSGLARLALERGGHLRLGLEDYPGPGTPSNEALIRAAVELARKVGRPIATPAQAAEIMQLPKTSLPRFA